MTRSVIIDTDPGVDDVLGILLALNSGEVDVKLISLCFGNCDTVNSLRNVTSLFHVISMENEFRRSRGRRTFTKQVPLVSVGMTHSLEGVRDDATDIHGSDGLGGVHSLAPQFTSSKEWASYFEPGFKGNVDVDRLGFKPSQQKSYLDILEVLRREPEHTVTIVAIGPLMNIAMAAEINPIAFSRVKEVVSMGGAINEPGNVTPLAEFNVFVDPVAAARVFALTSATPNFTLPAGSPESLQALPKPIRLVLFPLDITHQHVLFEEDFDTRAKELLAEGSPLAEWMQIFVKSHFEVMKSLIGSQDVKPAVHLHDPLAVYYAFAYELHGWKLSRNVDVRVETQGQWAKGATIVDRRGRSKLAEFDPADRGAWRYEGAGNKVDICLQSPFPGNEFGKRLLDTIFDYEEM